MDNLLVNEYLNYIQERIFISDQTISIDLDKFISGENKKLLIAGLSGGGKTTLSRYLSKKYNAEHFETDNCIHKMKHPMRNFGKINPPIQILKEVFREGYDVCVRPGMKNGKRQVVEGGLVWQNYVFMPEIRKELNKHSVIIFGSSALKASYNIIKRLKDRDKTPIDIIKKFPKIYERNFKLLSSIMDTFREERIKAGGNIEKFEIPKL
jgi:shikimate kinase